MASSNKEKKKKSKSSPPMQDDGVYEKVGLYARMPFGKYRGMQVLGLILWDVGYVQWLDEVRSDFFTDEVKKIINGEEPIKLSVSKTKKLAVLRQEQLN